MIKKSLIHLSCLGLLFVLPACGGSPEDGSAPSTSEPVMETFSINEPSATASADGPEPAASATQSKTPLTEPEESPSTEPQEPAPADEIPSSIQGRWIFVGDGEKTQECTDVQEGEGTIVEVDATTISSFAWIAELESVEESDADSILGMFVYQDDSDEPITQQVKLETQEDGEILVYTELGEDVDLAPARYGRCS